MSRVLAFLSFVLLAGCEGPVGPSGPEGPEGPIGPAGAPATSHHLFGVLDSGGDTEVALPRAAGTNPSRPPPLSCFVGGNNLWRSVATSPTGAPWCGLIFHNNRFNAALLGSTPGDTAMFVVVY